MFSIVFNFCYYAIFGLVPIVIFVIFNNDDNFYSTSGPLYLIKFICGRREIAKKQKKIRKALLFEDFNSLEDVRWLDDKTQSDRFSLAAIDQNGNQLSVELTLKGTHLAELHILLRIDKRVYILPHKFDSRGTEHPILLSSVARYQWKCPGVSIEILEPFKRFRLNFNGFLMDISPEKYGHVEQIRMSLIWNSSSEPKISTLDDDLNCLASSLAKTTWKDGHWIDLLGDDKGYLQFGGLRGQISIADNSEREFNMACVKRRYWGTLESIVLNEYLRVFVATENGLLLNFGLKSLKKGCQALKFGHVLTQNGRAFPIQDVDLTLDKIEKSISKKITVYLKANNKTFQTILTMNNKPPVFVNNDFIGFKHEIISGDCSVDSRRGFVILDHWYSHKGTGVDLPTPILTDLKLTYVPDILVLPIQSEEAKISELTGGKGCSLALMKSLNDNEFIIPDGFIVTTSAFQQQIDSNFNLKKSLALLEDVILGKEKGNAEEACQATVELFQEQTIIPSVSQKISEELAKFKKTHDDKMIPYLRWAVRSSAVGEDSEEFSAAGQNDTFLGCQTNKDVLKKICFCWASLFTYKSVMYRRQHGLPIRTSMAVVVQQMVPSESAGVLFTYNPTNSNPAEILITSNFGLGETVVSGQSEPDTFVLSKTFDGTVKFKTFSIGSKTNRIILSRFGMGTQILQENNVKDLSLSKEQTLKLGSVGVKLEKAFGGPRDIEWAFFKNELYILQSRPITTLNQWTDYDLLHELDTPYLSNETHYTRANIGEVCPFALTPLTQTTILDYIEYGYQIQLFEKYNNYANISISFSHHYGMIDILSSLYAKPRKELDVTSRVLDLAIFGHPVLNEELNKKAIQRNGLSSTTRELLFMLKNLWKSSERLKLAKHLIENNKIDIAEKDTVIDIYRKIQDYLKETFLKVALAHMTTSMISVVYQTFAMICLMESEKEFTLDHQYDLSLILSSSTNVISAEIPVKLKEIAIVLKNSNLAEQFISIDSKEGMEWLKQNSEQAYELLQVFLKNHGHRILGEMELSINPWGVDPNGIIEMIQTNCRLDSDVKTTEINHERDVVRELISPTKETTRMILRFLIKKNRAAVANREASKSCLVKATDEVRMAFKKLGNKMVLQGLIPSQNLIFHFTNFEVWQILHGKNFSLIPKAMRRQRLYPVWNKFTFPEIMYTMPEPITNVDHDYDKTDANRVCTGTPVCAGEVTGRACVITSLEEIKCLKEGDILITKSTDIGWSPYFPILAGLATELGGLVSHGAVVAREYGLPCVVGTRNATLMFKTGDKVILSGSSGTIKLVKNGDSAEKLRK